MNDPEPSDKPRVSIAKRLFLGAALIILLLIALGVGQFPLQRMRDASRLRQTLADLDESDPGWRSDALEEARPAVPDEGNSAPVVLAAYHLFPKGVKHLQALRSLDEIARPNERLDLKRASLLEKELQSLDAALEEARKLAALPAGRHSFDLVRTPQSTQLPHAQATASVGRVLSHDALHLAEMGALGPALRSCRAALNTGRSMDDEPSSSSQFVRIDCVTSATRAAERTLALGVPPVEELAALQKLAQQEEAHPTLLVMLRGERARLHELFTGLADGRFTAKDLGREPAPDPGGRRRLVLWNFKNDAVREHARILALMGQAIDNARLPPHEQVAAERRLSHEIKALPRDAALTQHLFPAVEMEASLCRHKLARMRCLQVLLAVERYRQEKGAWPAKLADLTPKHLTTVPLDPFDGEPVRYRAVADGVVVYTTGPDRRDDGGNLPRGAAASTGADVGYRLWNVRDRRKPPAPAPKGKRAPPAPKRM
jgi:hypothetical protein